MIVDFQPEDCLANIPNAQLSEIPVTSKVSKLAVDAAYTSLQQIQIVSLLLLPHVMLSTYLVHFQRQAHSIPCRDCQELFSVCQFEM